MPIYEYHCDTCRKDFELVRKISDPPIKSCPECNGRKIRKLISSTAFQLKGTGWYKTDYAPKPAAKKEEGKKEEPKKGETTDTAKTVAEKKPEAPKRATSKSGD